MKFIGDSINEAIDWTQDRLVTTRPLAERTLFAMLSDKKAHETEQGYMILEDSDDELQKRHRNLKQGGGVLHGQNGGYRFHHLRRHAKKHYRATESQMFLQKLHHMQKMKGIKHMDYPDAASGMLETDDPDAV